MQIEKSFTQRQAELSATKQALLAQRLRQLRQPAALPASSDRIGPRPSAQILPLSFAQQRLWFLQQLEPESPAYNEAIATRFSGPLDLTAFTQVAREFLRRHEIMRCRFPLVEGRVQQVLDQEIHQRFVMPCEDLRSLPTHQREAEVQRRALAELRRPFDLAHELPWRTFLWQLAEQEFLSLTVLHHLITDGWSLAIFYREIGQLYAAFSEQQPSPLPEPTLHYADYAHWQHAWLQSEQAASQLRYWQERLHAPLPVLHLPLDHPRPAAPSSRGTRAAVRLDASLTAALRSLGQQSGCTLFMVLLTGLFLLLHRYSQQDDLLIGTPVAGRTRPELEELFGCFVNTLALRADLSGNPSVLDLLQRVRAVTLGAYDHQDVPFEKLVELVQPERSLNRHPFFSVLFVLQNTPISQASFRDLLMTPVELDNATAKFDLELSLSETSEGVSGYFEYCTDLFEAASMERLVEHYRQLLRAMSADPSRHIDELPLLSASETNQVLEVWNETRSTLPGEESFAARVARQAQQTPARPALSDEREQLTYQELQERAAALAALLQRRGIGPEVPVGIYSERSVAWGVAVLAIFQAGGVYLPLDPQHPRARTLTILQQSSCQVLLTTRELADAAQAFLANWDGQVVYLEEVEQAAGTQPCDPHLRPAHLAYLIYTSGSTGKPKGVMIEQRGMLNHLYAKIDELHLCEEDIVAQTASQCFDISLWQLCAAWLVGAQVRIYAQEVMHDPRELSGRIARDEVSIVEIVPSFLRAFLTSQAQEKPELPHLRWLIPTGEALTPDLVRLWLEAYPSIPLLNAYGPTECSDDVTHELIEKPLDADYAGAVAPIGTPLPNLRVYVLDQFMQPTPVGIRGEIYVGGVGVGRGYLEDAAQTASAFVPDPWSKDGGERLYRTGDLGYYLPDGRLVCVGRIDEQVKVRGYRIEPGEIAAALREQSSVHDCVVVCQETGGDPRLVAYVVCQPGTMLDKEEMRRALGAVLPEYMIPALVPVASLPYTPNGKLDRRALPGYSEEDAEQRETAYIAPRNPLEEQLATIWAEVLALPRVGVEDNFFAIGGHSLLITQILARINDTLQVTLPVRTLFKNPTIAGLAEAIEKTRARSNELRKQAVVSISRDAFRQKRSAFAAAVSETSEAMKGEDK